MEISSVPFQLCVCVCVRVCVCVLFQMVYYSLEREEGWIQFVPNEPSTIGDSATTCVVDANRTGTPTASSGTLFNGVPPLDCVCPIV